MSERTDYPSGAPCWVDTLQPDPLAAAEFYGRLFGWRTNEFGGDYHVVENGAAGAIAAKDAQLTHPRIYFHTADIDASVKLVQELGGKSDDVQTVPDVGRIAHCQDDQGTAFSLFQPA